MKGPKIEDDFTFSRIFKNIYECTSTLTVKRDTLSGRVEQMYLQGLIRELNPELLAPNARITPLDQRSTYEVLQYR